MESYNFEKNIFPTTSKKIVYEKDPNNNNESSIIISPPLSPKKYSSKKKDRYNNTDGNDNDNDGGIIVNSTNETVQKPSTTFNNIQDVYDYLASCDNPRYRMKWCEIPNELREFIEINKKITSINHSSLPSSRTLPHPVLSTESSPINTTTGSTNANVIYVHNVAAGSSSSSSSQTYDGRHVYTSSFSSPPLPPPSSITSTTTTTPPSFDVMRIDIINNNNIISNNNNNNGKKEFSHGYHRHQPYSTKPFKSNDKAFSYKRSNIKGKERGIYEDNHFNTYMSSINTTSTLGQSSGTCSSDSTPPISPKNYNNKSLSHIITKKQQRKKSSNNNNNNNIRRSSDVNAISINRQYGIIKSNSASSTIAERKRKSNSLARVMADRGLFEESIIPIISSTSNSGEVKSIRIPPSPPLEYEKLIENLNNMNLKNGILNTAEPNITWKGQSLSITHLPHYDALHPKEAFVASALRLTPVQYLTAKHTLVSAAQRYSQRNFPFKKSDAQKLLRIDVNKASKLWEFFRQVEWI